MGAPTWPPTPEEADRATLEEYGDYAAAVLAASKAENDEEAERALLAPFLFGTPRKLADGREVGTRLSEVGRSLSGWLTMLSGLPTSLAHADPPATDKRRILLPRALPGPASPGEDALIYRVMALMQLGLRCFGVLDSRPLLAEIHSDWVYRSCLHLLAGRAIKARWIALWPGLEADFVAIRLLDRARGLRVNHAVAPRQGLPVAFAALLDGLYETDRVYHDVTRGSEAALIAAQRAVAAIDALPEARLLHNPSLLVALTGAATALRVALKEARLGAPPLPWWLGILRPEWILDDLARDRRAEDAWMEGPAPLRLLRDLSQRHGEARSARAKLAGALRSALSRPEVPSPALTEQFSAEAAVHDEEGHVYDEWHDETASFRAGHTRVLEQDAPAGDRAAYQRFSEALDGPIREVRRRFEALKVEERWSHGHEDGPELDIGRLVAAVVDMQAGWSPSRPDWYARYVRQRRDLVVLVLVDLSGSTHGGTLYREQEALVVLSEGLRVLGLPHAFHGFSNDGPQRCVMQRIKAFDDPYDEVTQRRLAGLRAGGATRLGAFLRHAGWMLSRRPQSKKLLLLVSDGQPEDRDGYRGMQGVADSAVAAAELRRAGVVLHCTSLDARASGDREDYLRRIFGPGRYLVLERAEELPSRLPEVLRGLLG